MHSEPPDRELDAGEQQRIAELTADQLRAIDDALLDLAQMRTVSGEFRISTTRSEFARLWRTASWKPKAF